MILHPSIVLKSIYRRYLGLFKTAIIRPPLRSFLHCLRLTRSQQFCGKKVVNEELVKDRHLRICRILHQQIQKLALPGHGTACEIGAGDCLASSDLLLGYGFEKVYVVEKSVPEITVGQVEVLREIASHTDLPNQLDVLLQENGGCLNSERVILVEKYFEESELPELVDLIVSFDVLEHVEDVSTFFRNCHRALSDGGVMIHKFDLSGHGLLEDPVPPLDFQTYPDWLYHLMYSKYRRAVRNWIDTFTKELLYHGFKDLRITAIRTADPAYVAAIRPRLRKAASHLTDEQISFLDVVITASK